MNRNITPVILCGGSGTRLWPLSRRSFPKQFLQIDGAESLFQKTLERLTTNPIYNAPVVITNNDHRFLVAEQARQMGAALGAILLEPVERNTAAAIGAVTAFVQSNIGDGLLHVVPSDHLIKDDDTYRKAILCAIETAHDGYLVTFGVTPTNPATGYGYIKAEELLSSGAQIVQRFIEKPTLEKATKMLTEGGFSWNSGMFLFRTDIFLSELASFEPEIHKYAVEAVKNSKKDMDFVRLNPEDFANCRNISVDYAVFEYTENAAVVPAAIQWSDIGSWQSFWQSQSADENGNAVCGAATLIDSHDNMIISDGQHIALNAVSGLTVVATDDAVLVSANKHAERIKDLVALLTKNEKTNVFTKEHKTNYRPWGGYTSILNGDGFQVKRLFVSPGKKLSLQKHKYRSEHWVVVSGSAEVTIDDEIMILSENESTYIPLGAVHRLANPGSSLLEVIEVQSGSYLGEDDIIRLEDDYGRGRDEC